jgi:ATP-dependent RNA helicase DDX52/ROK1
VLWSVLSVSLSFHLGSTVILTGSTPDRDTPLPLIAQSLTYVADDHSKLPTLRAYLSQSYDPPVLVFTSSQPRATSLAEELVLNGIRNVDCLHAGMTRKERDDAVSRMRGGESWVMISTEVMARGMDFRGIREVINYDFPRSVQSYVHRIGQSVHSVCRVF